MSTKTDIQELLQDLADNDLGTALGIRSDIQETVQDLFDNDLHTSLAIRSDIQDVLQDLWDNTLRDEGLAQTAVYHSAEAATGGTYDPETGTLT
jgi:hypothetical protein